MRTFIIYLCLCSLLSAEDWPGLEKMGPRHNASGTDIRPGQLNIKWQRTFHGLRFQDWSKPINSQKLPGAKGSRNLCLLNGKIAVIARDGDFDHEKMTREQGDWFVTVLDAKNGSSLNCIKVMGNVGSQRVYHWPHGTVSQGCDNVTGFMNSYWDPETGILFLANSGYDANYSAYLPLANADSYEQGKPQKAVPAYQEHAKHEAFVDSFGKTRKQQRTHQGTTFKHEEALLPSAWGPAGVYPGDDGKSKHCFDYTKGLKRDNPSFYNLSGLILGGPGGLIGISCSEDWGHTCAGVTFWYHAATGMKAMSGPLNRDEKNGPPLSPFKHEGGLVVGDRIFCAGPGQDVNGNKQLGHAKKSIGTGLANLDQGLAVWSYKINWQDLQENGGYTGAGSAETATFDLQFAHRLDSTYDVKQKDHRNGAQSWYEQDGFHRNKAFIADGESAWFAWKPSADASISLAHVTKNSVQSYDLGIAQGLHGVDIWPHMSLAEVAGKKYIVYMNGVGQHRKRYIPETEDSQRAHDHAYAIAGAWKKKNMKTWDELDEETRKKKNQSDRRRGFWSDEMHPPRGDASVVVFDCEQKKIITSINLSKAYPNMPQMGFWTFLDKCQMLVAGKYAYAAWIDNSAEQAQLQLISFDISAENAKAVEQSIPLNFKAKKSVLHDLIASDGQLYALVTESEHLWIRDPRWDRQHVIAMGQ